MKGFIRHVIFHGSLRIFKEFLRIFKVLGDDHRECPLDPFSLLDVGGRAALPAGRASEPEGRASKPAGKALDTIGRASEQARRASEEGAALGGP